MPCGCNNRINFLFCGGAKSLSTWTACKLDRDESEIWKVPVGDCVQPSPLVLFGWCGFLKRSIIGTYIRVLQRKRVLFGNFPNNRYPARWYHFNLNVQNIAVHAKCKMKMFELVAVVRSDNVFQTGIWFKKFWPFPKTRTAICCKRLLV